MADDKHAALNAALMAGNMYGPNPYTQYQGRLPGPTYRGMPTDAMGRPIQPPPGTTLNTTPAAAAPAVAPAQPDMMAMRNAALTSQPGAALAYGANFAPQGSPPGIQAMYGRNFAAFTPQRDWSGAGAGAPAVQTPAPAPPDNSYQNALDLLSNPGKVTTPGANVPATQPISNQPSVLDQFLANQKGGQGAGNYSNAGFFDTLNRLRGNIADGGDSSGSSLNPSGASNGGMPPPAQGVPGSAFSRAPIQGGTPSWQLGGGGQGNSLAGMGNWSGQVPAGGLQGGWGSNTGPGSPFESAPEWAAAQRRLTQP